MLTIQQITEKKEATIAGLNKKHFPNAAQTIEEVIVLNDKRKNIQNQLDQNLAQQNVAAKSIGLLMREGKQAEAQVAKQQVAELKENSKTLQADKEKAEGRSRRKK